MNKTYEVLGNNFDGSVTVHVFEYGRRILTMDFSSFDIQGVMKVLDALGYRKLYSAVTSNF